MSLLTASLKAHLKTVPLLVSAKRFAWEFLKQTRGYSAVNVLQAFPLFVPYIGGGYRAKANFTIQAINRTIPLLNELSWSVGAKKTSLEDIQKFSDAQDAVSAKVALKSLFDKYGSDKGDHSYHHLYGAILKDQTAIRAVLEIGLGTNNVNIPANMGVKGRPGASLRAFRDFLPNAAIYGADIDRAILFKEDRIETFFVDQTDPATFAALCVPEQLDLIIDDGLHSVDANIATLQLGISRVKMGGWVVIEDISFDSVPVWQLVAALLPSGYASHLLQGHGGVVFAVQRLSP